MNWCKTLLHIIVFWILPTSISAKPLLVIVQGPSSTGSSSLCYALKALYSNWELVIVDEYLRQVWFDTWQEHCPDDFLIVKQTIEYQNLFMAIKQNIIFFPADCSAEQEAATLSAIERIQTFFDEQSAQAEFNDYSAQEVKELFVKGLKETVLDVINKKIALNKSIIMEDFILNDDDIAELATRVTIVKVLTYCPLTINIERMFNRNEAAFANNNLWDHRFFRYLLRSFLKYYIPVKDSNSALLGSISRDSIEACFLEIEHKLLIFFKNSLTGEFTVEELKAYKEQFYEHFNLIDNQEISIEATINYDLIVDTKVYSAHEGASQVEEYLKSKL